MYIQVSDNGIISLDNSYNNPYPESLPISGTRFIAPYWADADLRSHGQLYYRQTENLHLTARAADEIQGAFSLSQNIVVTKLVIVTWDAVGFYRDLANTDKVHYIIIMYM